ncbi:MAG: pyridoxamine 5'-phosphate oxidase family protein [Myxococcota bacterium]
MNIRMTKEERESFLAGVHIGVLSIPEEGRGPLCAPVWYAYEPGGDLWFETEAGSRKAGLLKEGGRFSLLAQTETPPYRYVSVEGPVASITPGDLEGDTRPMAHRYLGAEVGDGYIEATGGTDARAKTIVVRMRPERWLTADYAKQFST